MRVLSLGAGVQSSTLALMSVRKEIAPFDAAVFADTKGEPAKVYEWLDYLESKLDFPLYRVSAGSLEERELTVRRSKKSGKLWMKNSIPAFVAIPAKVVVEIEYASDEDEDNGVNGVEHERLVHARLGMLGRKCTADFKISPITKELRRLAGIKRAPRDKSLVLIDQAIGISLDEYQRMKPSKHSWIKHYWPLVDLNMTRTDCLAWMQSNGYPVPPRSACRFCPFHSDAEWSRLKAEEPKEFELAVKFERNLQAAAAGVLDGVPYLHSSAKPLDKVLLDSVPGHIQVDMFNNECEGLCGV